MRTNRLVATAFTLVFLAGCTSGEQKRRSATPVAEPVYSHVQTAAAPKIKEPQDKSRVSSSAVGRITILGQRKNKVDEILSGWAVRRSRLAAALRDVYSYSKDVKMLVMFTDGKAVGVAVVDLPGLGYSPISVSRFEELCAMIGEYPKDTDIGRDDTGIREFYIGDVD